MVKRNLQIISIAFACLAALSLMLHSELTKRAIAHEGTDLSTTLHQAYVIGEVGAKTWDKSAELTMVISGDNPGDMSRAYGADGRRKIWTLDFASPDKPDHLLINIVDGRISNVTKSNTGNRTIDMKLLKIDSTDVVKIALQKFQLKPGIGFAEGYHFILKADQSGRPIVTVLGTDRVGYAARISFDGATSSVYQAIHKVAQGGGLYLITSRDGTQYVAHDKDHVQGIAIGADSLVAWGTQNPASATDWRYFVEFSMDSGATWTDIPTSTFFTNLWINSSRPLRLLATSDREVWSGTPRGFAPVLNCSESIVAAGSNGNTIAVATSKYLYVSINAGANWYTYPITEPIKGIVVTLQGDIYLQLESAITKVQPNGTSTVVRVFDTHILRGIRGIGDDVVIWTSKKIITLNGRQSLIDDATLLSGANNVWVIDADVYISSSNNSKLVRVRGGDAATISTPVGSISSVEMLQGNKIFVSLIPQPTWEKWGGF